MANRFWVLDTGTWDSSDTTHWSATDGGLGGASVPGASDAVVFNANSCLLNGTVTVNTTVAVQSITCGALTGTLDFSAHNNNVTLSTASGFNGSGTGARTINLGNGVFTLTAAGASWNFLTTTSLTFNANSSSIVFTVTTTSAQTFAGGGLTYNSVTFNGNTSLGLVTISGANTFATMVINAPNAIAFPNAVTTTITNAFAWSGSAGLQLYLISASVSGSATISVASGAVSVNWAAVRLIDFTGGATFTAGNSFNLGRTSGITITPPTMTRSRGRSGFA